MYVIFHQMYAEHYIFCGFQVSKFQVSGNLETSGNQQKPGNNLHVLLMHFGEGGTHAMDSSQPRATAQGKSSELL
jgi:hypothetical protein